MRRSHRKKFTAFLMVLALMTQGLSGFAFGAEAADEPQAGEQGVEASVSAENPGSEAPADKEPASDDPAQSETAPSDEKNAVSNDSTEPSESTQGGETQPSEGEKGSEEVSQPSAPEEEVSQGDVPAVSGNDAEEAAGEDLRTITDVNGDKWLGWTDAEDGAILKKYLGDRKNVVIPVNFPGQLVGAPGSTNYPTRLESDFSWGDNRNNIETVSVEIPKDPDMSTSLLNCDPDVIPGMFQGMTALKAVDFSRVKLIRIGDDGYYDVSDMFNGCKALERVTLFYADSYNPGSYIISDSMFKNCENLEMVDLSRIYCTGNTGGSYRDMFSGCTKLKTVYFDPEQTNYWENCAQSSGMFAGCISLVGGDGTEYDTNHVDSGYARLDDKTNGNPGYFTNVDDMLHISIDGWSYEPAGEDNWVYLKGYVGSDTDIVIPATINHEGKACKVRLNENYYSNPNSLFDDKIKKKVTSVRAEYGVELWSGTALEGLFSGCTELKSVDLSRIDLGVNTVENTNDLFNGCTKLEKINLFRQEYCTDLHYMINMFKDCKSLEIIDFSDVNLKGISASGFMVSGCSALRTIYVFRRIVDGDVVDRTFPDQFNDGLDMFDGCVKLKGMKGTTYDEKHINAGYARIDGLDGQPGYFSTKFSTGWDDIDKYTYDFINTYGSRGLGYEESWKYHIPEKRYQELFDEKKGSNIFNYFDDEWGGSCFGLSATSSMFLMENAGDTVSQNERRLPKISDFGGWEGSHPKDLQLRSEVDRKTTDDEEKQLYEDLRKYIEAMQISQYDERVQFCYSLDAVPEELVKEIEYEEDGYYSYYPTIIGMFGPEGGHAVLGYAVEREGQEYGSSKHCEGRPIAIHIYDSNWPGEDRKIELRSEPDGSCTLWHYDILDKSNEREGNFPLRPWTAQRVWSLRPRRDRQISVLEVRKDQTERAI